MVRLVTMERRNEISHNKPRLPSTSGDIFEVDGDAVAQNIYQNPHVTPHFGKISSKARAAMKEKNIFSFYISTQGLTVKLTDNSYAIAIISLDQKINQNYSSLWKLIWKRMIWTNISLNIPHLEVLYHQKLKEIQHHHHHQTDYKQEPLGNKQGR